MDGEVAGPGDIGRLGKDDSALITLTREYLQSGQSVTVKWVVSHVAS